MWLSIVYHLQEYLSKRKRRPVRAYRASFLAFNCHVFRSLLRARALSRLFPSRSKGTHPFATIQDTYERSFNVQLHLSIIRSLPLLSLPDSPSLPLKASPTPKSRKPSV
jgi:hypothetical protein